MIDSPDLADPPVAEPALLSTAQVAARFGVTRRAVTQWAAAGRIEPERTELGHHRYRAADVDALLRASLETAR